MADFAAGKFQSTLHDNKVFTKAFEPRTSKTKCVFVKL